MRKRERDRQSSRGLVAEDLGPLVDLGTRSRWGGWVVCVAAVVAMGGILFNDFGAVDDVTTIVRNEHLAPPVFRADGAWWFWRHPHMSLYVPVTYTVWAVLAAATYVPTPDELGAHVDARLFHAASLVAHVCAAMGVLTLLRRLLRDGGGGGGRGEAAAVLGALVFAVHPVQVEAVAWTSGLKDVLCGCLAVWAIVCHVRAGDEDNRRSAAAFHLLALLAYAGSILSKPTGVFALPLAALIDGAFLGRPMLRVARSLAPWLLAAVPLAVVARLSQTGVGIPIAPVWQRPVIAAAALAFYGYKLVWPATLTFDYGWHPTDLRRAWGVWAMAAGTAAVAATLWSGRGRRPWLLASAAAFVIPLLPVLGLVRFEFLFFSLVGDHYLYLPMLGVAIGVAFALRSHVADGASRRGLTLTVAGFVLASLAVRSAVQVTTWRNDRVMSEAMLRANPASPMAYNGLGLALERRDDLARAVNAFQSAAVASPDLPAPHENLSRIYLRMGRPLEAIDEIRAVLRMAEGRPMNGEQRAVMEAVLAGLEALRDRRYAEAVRAFREWARLRPDDAEARESLQMAERALAGASSRPATRPT